MNDIHISMAMFMNDILITMKQKGVLTLGLLNEMTLYI